MSTSAQSVTDMEDGVEEAGEDKSEEETNSVKFGWFEGVFMRCLLNIWGVMLFLRLTWVVGHAGILEGLGVVLLANVVTVITTVSMSAVCTNGQIKAGGIYYMISRSLGPEFGGAIGLMFTVANSIGVSMYIIGFCGSFRNLLVDQVTGFTGVIGDEKRDIRLIGSVTLVALLAVTLVGMEWVTRVQKFLLLLLVAAQLDFLVGTFLPPSEEERAKGFVGWNSTVAYDNLWSNYIGTQNKEGQEEPQSFFSVFAVFFPAVTGIVAGANLSGDLRDPAEAIPKGTLLAVGTTFVSYVIYLVVTGCVALRYAPGPGLAENFTANHSVSLNHSGLYGDCISDDGLITCTYGNINEQMMNVISAWGPVIYAGCFAATLSSAISSLEGAPRVLQALAKDKLFPYIETFSVGYGNSNSPIRGYIAVFAVSLICILIGDLDVVAGLQSNFFVAAYALVNFSVFHASVTKSPGWRPGFKYYNKWLSLVGTVLCIAVMFLMDHQAALITFIIIIILYVCVCVRKPQANWGSSTQAQSFMAALKASQGLLKVSDHIKNYRPKLLVVSGQPSHRPSLVEFANLMTKKISLMTTLHIIPDETTDWKTVESLRTESQDWLLSRKIKSFHAVTRNNSFSEGVRSALELQGLSKLAPNMILLGFKENWRADSPGSLQYFSALHQAMQMKLAVGILRLPSVSKEEPEQEGSSGVSELKLTDSISRSLDSGLELESVSSSPGSREAEVGDDCVFRRKVSEGQTIDIYWLYDDGGLTLLIPHILHTRKIYSACKMRLFFLCSKADQLDSETRAMIALLGKFRIEAEDVIIISDATKRPGESTLAAFAKLTPLEEESLAGHQEKTNFHLRISEVVRDYSSQAALIVMTLPVIKVGSVPGPLYLSWLDILTRDSPPTLLLRGNQDSVLTFYS